MSKIHLFLLCLMMHQMVLAADKETVKSLPAKNLRKWHVPTGGYSGITSLGGDSFAIVSDCHTEDAVKMVHIDLNPKTGKLRKVFPASVQPRLTGWKTNEAKSPDYEDIAYCPRTGTMFIASEAHNSVSEHDMRGVATGKVLSLSQYLSEKDMQSGYGIESLAYDKTTGDFWITSEAALKTDGTLPYGTLRLWCVSPRDGSGSMYRYQMDSPKWKCGAWYAHGVSALLATDDGRLLVMERELCVPPCYVGARTQIKIYEIHPDASRSGKGLTNLKPLEKRLITKFITRLRVGKANFANYEGMAWGPCLEDGRQTLLLVCDSQNGKGNALFRLKDFLKVIVLPKGKLLLDDIYK